jgi:hypothetical protein
MSEGVGLVHGQDSNIDRSIDRSSLQAYIPEAVNWADPEQALETSSQALRGIASDLPLLETLIAHIESEDVDQSMGGSGSYWFSLAELSSYGVTVWLRFCPSGCVMRVHEHSHPLTAIVLRGGFHQTLVGVGGGVASPAEPTQLYLRQEAPGQVFSLAKDQLHSTSSTAGSVLLVLTPVLGPSDTEEKTTPAKHESTERVTAAIRKLRRVPRSRIPWQ